MKNPMLVLALVGLSCGGHHGSNGPRRNMATVAVTVFCSGNEYGSGSGVVISPNQILTAAHVTKVCDGSMFQIGMEDGSRFDASVEASWPGLDLARLKIVGKFKQRPVTKVGGPLVVEDQICFHSGAPTRAIRCGRVEKIEKGGLGNVKHSAVVEPGNSGSPVFDSQGALVGIITHYYKCQNGQLCGGKFSSVWDRRFVLRNKEESNEKGNMGAKDKRE